MGDHRTGGWDQSGLISEAGRYRRCYMLLAGETRPSQGTDGTSDFNRDAGSALENSNLSGADTAADGVDVTSWATDRWPTKLYDCPYVD